MTPEDTTPTDEMMRQARDECGDDMVKRGIFISGWLGAEQARASFAPSPAAGEAPVGYLIRHAKKPDSRGYIIHADEVGSYQRPTITRTPLYLAAPPAPSQPAAAQAARQLVSVSSIDIERMLAECVPAGSLCDPQAVADDIRRYCNAWDASPAQAVPLTDEQIDSLNGLDTPRRVRFYEHDFYVLSNFSAFRLMWKGVMFDTSEAAYHFEKFPHLPLMQDAIISAPSAHEAFKVAETNKGHRRPDWDSVKVGIMRDILRAKVDQHEYVRRKLLATGDRELVEDSWRDDFWGWGPNRDGQNMLGKLWMEVRAELRDPGITAAPQAAPVAQATPAPSVGADAWQPIETAPADVDVFLWATKRGGRAFIGKWGDYDKYNEPRITHWAPIVPPAAPTLAARTAEDTP